MYQQTYLKQDALFNLQETCHHYINDALNAQAWMIQSVNNMKKRSRYTHTNNLQSKNKFLYIKKS